MSKEELWSMLRDEILKCTKCRLHMYRKNPVPGEGPLTSKVMFIGEAPGAQEDEEGRPFVGAAGKLLTELLEKYSIGRDNVFITNILKCRPPGNRDPMDDEVEACTPYLKRQIELIKPMFIVCLGRYSSNYILSQAGVKFTSMSKARGRVYDVNIYGLNVEVYITYHPAAALYKPPIREVLELDFKKLSEMVKAKVKTGTKVTLNHFLRG